MSFCLCFGLLDDSNLDTEIIVDEGELTTSGQKKKKTKSNEEDVIVGGTFRVQSEFGPSSSRFKTKSMNGAKLSESVDKNGSVKPQNWCGTTVPKQGAPPPPGGYSAEVTSQQNDVKPSPSKQLKSNLKKAAPVPPKTEPEINEKVNQEIKPQPEAIKIQTKAEKPSIKFELISENESEDEFGAKISKPTTQNLTSNQNDVKPVENDNQKKFITLDGFDNNDNERSDESEDEYGAKKSTKKTEDNTFYGSQTTSFEKVHIKQPQQSPKAPKAPQAPQAPTEPKSKSNFGYSDQAASIFFRSDSPEPEQRVRNFSIKKGDGDDDDNLSQTSA